MRGVGQRGVSVGSEWGQCPCGWSYWNTVGEEHVGNQGKMAESGCAAQLHRAVGLCSNESH